MKGGPRNGGLITKNGLAGPKRLSRKRNVNLKVMKLFCRSIIEGVIVDCPIALSIIDLN